MSENRDHQTTNSFFITSLYFAFLSYQELELLLKKSSQMAAF